MLTYINLLILLTINLGIIIPMNSKSLTFAYYYDKNGEYCKNIDETRAIDKNNYINLIKKQLLKYNININDFIDCSSIDSNYKNPDLQEILNINYCINKYINELGLNNLGTNYNNLLIISSNDSIATFNKKIYVDYNGNLYYLKRNSNTGEYDETNDKINEIELIYDNYNFNFKDTFTLSSNEFLDFLVKYFGIAKKYDENSLHELQDQYLTRDGNNFYLENIPFPYLIKTIKTNNYPNGIAFNKIETYATMFLNASTYETCLGLPYNLTNDVLEIHNLITITNNDIDNIFNNYNKEYITLKFKYTKGYMKDLPKLLRILKYINNNYEYRIDMCQVDKTYDTHEYITIDKYKCKYNENYDINEQIDNKCQDIIIDYNKDVISKNFNPAYVNFQIVGDTPINNYLRFSLNKTKAFAINEITPESINTNGQYKPRFEQNEIIDKFEIDGIIKSYYNEYGYGPIDVNINNITTFLKTIYKYKDDYSFNKIIVRKTYGTDSQSDYCYNIIGLEISDSANACIGTHYYRNNNQYSVITTNGNMYVLSSQYYTIKNETKYCENNIECDVDNCKECITNNVCSKCIDDNYLLNKTSNQCKLKCSVINCKECINDMNTCKICNDDYSLDENGKCKVKNCKVNGCQKCYDDDAYSCEVCKNGYNHIFNVGCEIICNVNNCTKCKSDDGSICQTCNDNYLLDENGKCKLRCDVDNCEECVNNPNTCKTCNDNYLLDENGKCKLRCDANNCKECKTGSITKCQICNNGYTLKNEECKLICNDVNCKTCDENANVCQECNNGYLLNNNNKCIIDENSICVVNNCKECEYGNNQKCKKCNDNYLLINDNENSNQCKLKCIADNCKECEDNSANICKECENGYLLNNIGECILDDKCIPDNCKICEDGNNQKCKTCNDNYLLINNECILNIPVDNKCKISNCKICEENDNTLCKECDDDYDLSIDKKQCNYFDNNSCLKFIILSLFIIILI